MDCRHFIEHPYTLVDIRRSIDRPDLFRDSRRTYHKRRISQAMGKPI